MNSYKIRSPQFNVDDIGLDLSRKVNIFHTISYFPLLFHTISYLVIYQSCGPHGQGLQRLDIDLLKPQRLLVAPRGNVISLRSAEGVTGWVQYQLRLQCPLSRYLPHFLATFIVENLNEALHFSAPPPMKPRQSSYKDQKGRKWRIGTLTRVLRDVLVPLADGTQIAVIECAEWESEN